LNQIKDAWSKSSKHFVLKLQISEMSEKINEKFRWMPTDKERYWQRIWEEVRGTLPHEIEFLCLSLDSNANPVKIMNSDVSSLIFISDFVNIDSLLKLMTSLVLPYPVGLFVQGLGILCANDNYATEKIWERFKNDKYHSPYVVWGREMNLILLGLLKYIQRFPEEKTLIDIFRKIYSQVSNLKHTELWTYKITNEKLNPVRYATSSDIQLWNLAELAVEFYIEKLNLR
jgi:hypothetical protein